MFNQICTPALIYLIFGLTHIFIAMFNQYYSLAMKEFLMTLLFTVILNFLCESGLTALSWAFIFIPFILMTVFIVILLTKNIDPKTGEMIEREKVNAPPNSDIVLYHDHGSDYDTDSHKHGVGVRQQHEIANPIEEKRNYRYELDTEYGGDIEVRHIRDQRLNSY